MGTLEDSLKLRQNVQSQSEVTEKLDPIVSSPAYINALQLQQRYTQYGTLDKQQIQRIVEADNEFRTHIAEANDTLKNMKFSAVEAVAYSPEREIIDQLDELNGKLSDTNQALQVEREERFKENSFYNEKISILHDELKKMNDANKWQTLKDLLIGLAGAVVGSLATYLISEWGNIMHWLNSLFT